MADAKKMDRYLELLRFRDEETALRRVGASGQDLRIWRREEKGFLNEERAAKAAPKRQSKIDAYAARCAAARGTELIGPEVADQYLTSRDIERDDYGVVRSGLAALFRRR